MSYEVLEVNIKIQTSSLWPDYLFFFFFFLSLDASFLLLEIPVLIIEMFFVINKEVIFFHLFYHAVML